VYARDLKLQSWIVGRGNNEPKLIGISKASTFNGFCQFHDQSIFTSVENRIFEGSQQQCFVLAYRALAREVYTKEAAASLEGLLRESDRGMSVERQQEIQIKNLEMKTGHELGMRDNDHHKTTYDQLLVSASYDQMRGYVIEFDNPPPIMCSAGLFPEQDFDGVNLQNVGDPSLIPKLITFTSFGIGTRGAAVFSWLADSDPVCIPFVESLDSLPDRAISGALIRYMFEFTENVHISPDWWEGLPISRRAALVKRTKLSMVLKYRPANILVYDGLDFDPWDVKSRYRIGY
jgi:hypothetical protein